MGEQHGWPQSGDPAPVPQARGSEACVCGLTSSSVSEQAARHGDRVLIFKSPLLTLPAGERLLHSLSSLLISTPSRTAPCRGSQPLGFQGFLVATAGLLVHVKWMDQLTTRTHVQIAGPGEDDFAASGLKSHLFSPLGKKRVVCIHSFAFPPLSLPRPGLCYPGFQGAPSRPSVPAQHRG